MIYSYPGCFFQRPDGKYCVVFADFNNLAAFGDDFDHALASATDLLARYICGIKARNGELPVPSDMSTLKPTVNDEYTRAFFQTVNVDAEEYAKYYYYEKKETSITLPGWLAEFARKENIDLSAAAERYLTQLYNEQHG